MTLKSFLCCYLHASIKPVSPEEYAEMFVQKYGELKWSFRNDG
jgi:hypothetical protein